MKCAEEDGTKAEVEVASETVANTEALKDWVILLGWASLTLTMLQKKKGWMKALQQYLDVAGNHAKDDEEDMKRLGL